jgi:hypothetical protein
MRNLVAKHIKHFYDLVTGPSNKVYLFISHAYTIPPLWSSGQSSRLQIQGSRIPFPGTTKKIVGLERGPLSLVSTTEELLDRKVAATV